jgi:CHC2 zinc finger
VYQNKYVDTTVGYPRGVSFRKPIEAARELVSVEELAERLSGAPGVKRGSEIAFRCPLHDDHDPSLLVDPARGVWYCFPCSKGGSVVELARLAWGHEESGKGAAEAAAFLLQQFGHELPERPPSWFAKQQRQKPMRELIREAKIEALTRRLWSVVFAPIVAEVEDQAQREQMIDRLWSCVWKRAALIVDEDLSERDRA